MVNKTKLMKLVVFEMLQPHALIFWLLKMITYIYRIPLNLLPKELAQNERSFQSFTAIFSIFLFWFVNAISDLFFLVFLWLFITSLLMNYDLFSTNLSPRS